MARDLVSPRDGYFDGKSLREPASSRRFCFGLNEATTLAALALDRNLPIGRPTMNLRRIAAIVVTALFGAAVGLLVGFLNSGLVGVSRGFWYWISYPPDSWHWPILGFLIGGLGSLAFHLCRPN
jgi:hypothetical protein